MNPIYREYMGKHIVQFCLDLIPYKREGETYIFMHINIIFAPEEVFHGNSSSCERLPALRADGWHQAGPEQGQTALHCTALHCTVPHCTALHCSAMLCTAHSAVY